MSYLQVACNPHHNSHDFSTDVQQAFNLISHINNTLLILSYSLVTHLNSLAVHSGHSMKVKLTGH